MKYRWHKVEHENGKTVIVDREEFHIICTVHKGALTKEDQQGYATLITEAPKLLEQVRMLNHELWRLGRGSKTAERLLNRIDRKFN